MLGFNDLAHTERKVIVVNSPYVFGLCSANAIGVEIVKTRIVIDKSTRRFLFGLKKLA